ncbi:MAG: toprim domain-containing protein [Rhizobiales bacterium]|nr:toprim domain-containing protein [Hyphomicrobiales bacterium]MBO6699340.1 toprim domain-containing protein [Hyphomicrobiales bacterium]MBO6736878.1 toprim domain-containing protein [Hyphomicrobiales bacterium]MBO6912048.1 toprim domain-containing protein [Hyphomicrobiales bacterium]MBO6954584.1 toprim domain-containing protein [Hyphomicrobiales bacterium]
MDSTAADLSQKLSREAEAVCRQYLSNGRKHGNYWIVGDVDNSPGRSLYVRLAGPTRGKGAAGKWTDAATGEHGDLLDLIAANLNLSTLRDTLEEARRFLSLPRPEPPARERQSPAPPGSPEAARRLWAMGQPIAGTLAERYLSARGLKDLRRVSALRFHPNCYYWREDANANDPPEAWPALLAKVTDTAGTLTGVHRTWFDPQTADKAPLDPNRKAMGNLLGHAVRIGSPTDVLAVGEGLETMLSLRQALAGLPIAAALSSNHLAAFDPPTDLRRLYVAIDNDAAGRAAFGTLTDRFEDSGLHLLPLRPMLDDFNGDLRKHGIDEMRSHLRPQLLPVDVPTLLAVETD